MRIIGMPFDEYSTISQNIKFFLDSKSVKPMKIKDRRDGMLNTNFPRTVYWTTYDKDDIKILKVWMDDYCVDFHIIQKTTSTNSGTSLTLPMLDKYVVGTASPSGASINGSKASEDDNTSFAKAVLKRVPKVYNYVILSDPEIANLKKNN